MPGGKQCRISSSWLMTAREVPAMVKCVQGSSRMTKEAIWMQLTAGRSMTRPSPAHKEVNLPSLLPERRGK